MDEGAFFDLAKWYEVEYRPRSMARPVIHTHCTIPFCDREHYGKGLCRMHYQRQYKSPSHTITMRSACCNSKTEEGEPHENGKQYCGRCKLPCFWRYS